MPSRAAHAHELESLLEHADWLRRLAGHLVRDPAAADDLVQETWLAAMRNPPDADRPARPWLAGVARRLASMRARSEGRRAARQKAAAKKDELPATADLVERVDTQRKLSEAVLELDEPYRTTVLLRYHHGLSSAEIARRQGTPEGTVRWRLKRGLDAMRVDLDQTFGDRRSWCLALGLLGEAEGAAEAVALPALGIGALLFPILLLFGLFCALFFATTSDRGGEEVQLVLAAETALPLDIGEEELAEPPVSSIPAARARAIEASPTTTAAFRILDVGGIPADDIIVVLVEASGAGHSARTDDEGWARLTCAPGPGTLFVKRDAGYLHREPYPEVAGEHQLLLPAGLAIEGRLTIDGSAPEEPVPLTLAIDRMLLGGEIPEPVQKEFGMARRANAQTDEEGRFAFNGLAPNWSGLIIVPLDYAIVGEVAYTNDSRALHIASPRTGVELTLRRRPRLTGLALRKEDGTPIANARLQLKLEPEGGRPLRTNDEGRFDVPWLEEPFEKAQLSTIVRKEVRARSVALDADALRSGDLGTLRLPLTSDQEAPGAAASAQPVEALAIEGMVVDRTGDPLVNVSLYVETIGQPRRRDKLRWATGTRGRFHIEALPADADFLRVEKRGFAKWSARIRELDKSRPITIQLERGYDVDVGVRDVNGKRLSGAFVYARRAGESRTWATRDDPLVLQDMPAGSMEFSLEIGGARYVRDHDPIAGALFFEVPVHGRVEVELAKEYSGPLVLYRWESLDQWAGAPEATHEPVRMEEGNVFPVVLPGVYLLNVEMNVPMHPNSPAAVEVTVEPGLTTTVSPPQ